VFTARYGLGISIQFRLTFLFRGSVLAVDSTGQGLFGPQDGAAAILEGSLISYRSTRRHTLRQGRRTFLRALARGNCEERNKVLVSSISIINSFIIIINAYYNYVV
jgi:hypothetical protein